MLELSPSDRQTLLKIARASIEAQVRGTIVQHPAYPESLQVRAGVFVSLHIGGALRGCIGSLQSPLPLWQATEDSARSAASRDPRFFPLSEGELGAVELEISVLSPFERVHAVNEIEPGRDGLMIRRGHRSGLLLPQVAESYGWGREEFLAQTCRKAGLPPDAWRDPGCEIEKFTALVFADK